MVAQDEADARLEIFNLLAAYNHCADSGDAEGYASLFTADATIDRATPTGIQVLLEGRENIAKAVKPSDDGVPAVQHYTTNVWVRTIGPTTATVCSYFVVFRTADGLVQHYGSYDDAFERCDDGKWRIKHHTVNRVFTRPN